ncbi:MAG TPA: polysaccharide deacetylase family protein [Myxococcales bacterium]|jgi:peptidoglycan/xylan/chitin deacetylase (PgdA/CDA1 family)
MLPLLLALACAHPTPLAFTFDDGPKLEQTPLLTPAARNQALLGALAKHHVVAGLFVTSGNGANHPEGLALVRAWGEAGHLVGNHTVTHPDLNDKKVSLEAYEQELLDCDAVIRKSKGYGKYFRFTYLREGNTPEKRDAMRAFLQKLGYRNAYVTLDTSDWRLNQALVEALRKDAKADLARFRKVYVGHLLQRAGAYRELSQKLFGRQVPQVILLHHNLIEALFLDDGVTALEDDCWEPTDPRIVYEDEIYRLHPGRPAPGQSLLLSVARSRGMDLKPYERLMDDGDAEIAALNAR